MMRNECSVRKRMFFKKAVISIIRPVVLFLLKFWYCVIVSFELFLLLMMEDESILDYWHSDEAKLIPRRTFIRKKGITTVHIHDAFSKGFVNMKKLWKSNSFCDVTVKVGDRTFEAHRIVLASTIPFFKSMFFSNMKESKQEVIELQNIDETALEVFLNFAYSGSVDITVDNVQSLIMGAPFFQLFEIQDVCAHFLEERFNADNIIGMHTLGMSFNCTRLVDAADTFMRQHFVDVTNSQEFLTLSLEEVTNIIQKDKIDVDSEEEVFHAVVRWIKHDEEQRGGMMFNLLRHVRLPLLTPSFLVNVVSREHLIKLSHECRDLVDEAKDYYLVPHTHSILPEYKTRVRCNDQFPDHIFVVGGLSTHGNALRTVEVFDPGMNAWYMTIPMFTSRSRLGVAAWRNEVYAIGGYDGVERLADVEVFNTIKLVWNRIIPMHFRRSAVGAAFLNNKLYICGGYNGSRSLNTVERYCPIVKKWTILASMSSDRSALGAVSLDNFLYVLGGHDGLAIFSSVERYDPSTGMWDDMKPMLVKRCRLGAAALDDKIYVCGGYDGFTFLNSVEVYDPVLDEWKFVEPMKVTRSRVALVACSNKLWAIGGYDGVTNLTSMEVYDPKYDTWTLVVGMSYHEGGVGAAVSPFLNPETERNIAG